MGVRQLRECKRSEKECWKSAGWCGLFLIPLLFWNRVGSVVGCAWCKERREERGHEKGKRDVSCYLHRCKRRWQNGWRICYLVEHYYWYCCYLLLVVVQCFSVVRCSICVLCEIVSVFSCWCSLTNPSWFLFTFFFFQLQPLSRFFLGRIKKQWKKKKSQW